MSGSPVKPHSPQRAAAAAAAAAASASASAAAPEAAAKQTPRELTQEHATLLVVFDEAQHAFHKRNYELAAQLFSQVTEAFATLYGPTHPKSADAHFRYGRALLNHAIEKAGILGDAEQLKNATGKRESELLSAVEGAAMPAGTAKEFHFGHEAEDDDGDAAFTDADADAEEEGASGSEGEDEDDDDDDEEELDDAVDLDDFEIAFEALDVARVIYSKMLTGELDLDATDLPREEDDEDAALAPAGGAADAKGKAKATAASTASAARLAVQRRYAEVLTTLADVSLESESFGQAAEDYTRALELQQAILPASDRRLAETHYKLALALEYAEEGDLRRALVHLAHARVVLERKADELERAGSDRALMEMREVRALLPELELKVDDVKRALYLREHPEAQDGDAGGSGAAGGAGAEAKEEAKPVNDLTMLVKKKAGAAAAPAVQQPVSPTAASKKRKLDDTAAAENGAAAAAASPAAKKARAEL